jgi:plastocyanin
MRCAVAVIAALVASAAATANAGEIRGTVTVKDHLGKPISAEGAIVYVVGFDEPPAAEVPEIIQRRKRFEPDLLAITSGQEVSFPNADPLLHNVFSRSQARRFDLGSYKKGQTKTKSFKSVGVVDVYCNIHPEMAATILVLPNRKFTRVAADGTFVIRDVPPGTWSVFAYMRLVDKPARVQVTVGDGAPAAASFALVLHAPVEHANKYDAPYRERPEHYR